jgi:hypothetical protein
MSDQGGANSGGQRPQGRRGRPWFKGRGKGEPSAPREEPRSEFQTLVRTPPPTCPICEKPVADILSALTERQSGEPAHFECVQSRIAEGEALGPQERVVYLGAGAFAVAETDPKNPQRIMIKRKVQYEERDKRAEWRKSLDRVVIR